MDEGEFALERYIQEVPIVTRWERWANEGKNDELFADAADVLGPHLSDQDYISLIFSAAVEHGAMSLAHSMLDMGATVDSDELKGGFTPLYAALASCRPSIEMINWLLEKGANPNCETIQGLKPLHLAVKQNLGQAIAVLVRHGAEINATDLDHGYTPLEMAAYLDRRDLASLLINHGAQIRPRQLEDIAAKYNRERFMDIVKTHQSRGVRRP